MKIYKSTTKEALLLLPLIISISYIEELVDYFNDLITIREVFSDTGLLYTITIFGLLFIGVFCKEISLGQKEITVHYMYGLLKKEFHSDFISIEEENQYYEGSRFPLLLIKGTSSKTVIYMNGTKDFSQLKLDLKNM